MIKPCIFLSVFFLFSLSYTYAQEVSGTVKSAEDHAPLHGVTVMITNSTNGALSNERGQFTLSNVTIGDSIKFSFIGFEEKVIRFEGEAELQIELLPTASSLDQIVVIGYGVAKKSDLTGAISQISGSDFENQPMTQLTDMLTGTVAGMNINQGATAAGGSSSMMIRGQRSLNASNTPMVVVDGSIFPGDLQDINPNDIENIDILKDASSAAIYGARAANGVIMVTTKKGKISDKPLIKFTTELGWSEVQNKYKPFDAKGYIKYKQDLLKDWGTGFPDFYFDNPNELPSGVSLEMWRNATNSTPLDNDLEEWANRLRFFPTEVDNFLNNRTIDWFNEVFRRGLRQDYDISLSGATENLKYFWSGNYANNEGIRLGDKFKTFRTRLNLELSVTKYLNIGTNIQFAANDNSGVPADIGNMFTSTPYSSLWDPQTGDLKFYTNDYQATRNPLLNTFNQNNSKLSRDLFSTIYLDLKLPFGLSYKISYQPHFVDGNDYNFWASENTLVGSDEHLNGYGTREENRTFEWILDNILHWDKEFGNHSFNLTLLYSSEEHKRWLAFQENENFSPNQNLIYNGMQFGTSPNLFDDDTRATGDALMGRLNYSFMAKYLLTLSVRRDGYSAFGQSKPHATFPAVALAWNMSDENFFQSNFIDNLRLRFSWGKNGNRDIGQYAALAQISPNIYFDGENTVVGVVNNTLANPNLSWEKTTSYNVGIESMLFNNRLSIDVNLYSMKTTDLLMVRRLPIITGFDNITTNLGRVDNKGFELKLISENIQSEILSWSSDISFSINRNKIKSLFGDFEEVEKNGNTVESELPDFVNEWFPGEAIDRIWNYKRLGIWQEDEADDAAVYDLHPGDIKALDVNGDGKYEENIDKVFIGYREPRYRIGFGNNFTFFKKVDVSLFLRADLGHKREFSDGMQTECSSCDRRALKPQPDNWTPTNPINSYPRYLNDITAFGGGINFFAPTGFLRFQNLSIGYRIENDFFNRLHLNGFRIYGSVRNLATITNWPDWDPESGSIPMPRTFTFGLSFSL